MAEKKFTFVKIIIAYILILGVLLIILSACNKQVIDFHYEFNYAYITIGNETEKIAISKWKDYEGEQLQVIDKDGNVYLRRYGSWIKNGTYLDSENRIHTWYNCSICRTNQIAPSKYCPSCSALMNDLDPTRFADWEDRV